MDSQTIRQSLGLAQGHAAVVGLQWGDEGKGKIVDMLASTPGLFDAVARYNGGANAGHTVVVGDQKYALHLMPSGILSADKINLIGNGVVIDPIQVVKEVVALRERGVKVEADNLRVSDRAHVVLPWHRTEDLLMEKLASSPIGTTGRGIGPAYADKALRTNAIRMGVMADPARRLAEITRVTEFKNKLLSALAREAGEEFVPFVAAEVEAEMARCMDVLAPMVTDLGAILEEMEDAGKTILFEGANATLLDVDHGTYPYVTSSSCSSPGVHTGTGLPGHKLPSVIGICKAYQTRVGGGPMPTELDDEVGNMIRERGREFGTTTGRPRRCGWLDLVALRYAVRICGVTQLCLMLTDVLEDFDEIKVCEAYEIDGEVISRFPADALALERVKPVWTTLKGFGGPVGECTRIDQMPQGARDYIAHIEKATGVPVVIASVGPGRTQTAWR